MQHSKHKSDFQRNKLKFYGNDEQPKGPTEPSSSKRASQGQALSALEKGRLSPGTRTLVNSEIYNYHIINSKQKSSATTKKKLFRKIDKDQHQQGYIMDKLPAERDGAILAIVERDAEASDGETGGVESRKREKVMVTMGGDRF